MRVCLIPLLTESRNPQTNLFRLEKRLEEAARHQPDLVCLPECALTGYLFDENDLRRFAEPVNGNAIKKISNLARQYNVYVCFGFLEKLDHGVADSAALIDRSGKVVLIHRKMSEQPPFVNGDSVNCAETEFGKMGILICGDLFDEETTAKIDRSLRLLIVPMARSFDDPSPNGERWVNEERQVYLDAIKEIGVQTVLVNALEESPSEASFGGALVVSAKGEALAESTHGTDRMATVDL